MGISVQELEQTIVALASARGAGERCVVRLSGEDALRISAAVCDMELNGQIRRNLMRPFHKTLSRNVGSGTADIFIDVPLSGHLLLWPDARSYTGQPAAEIHFRASMPMADSIVEECCAAGARVARAGEFTMRGFLAGRMDLTQAEAVLGVIHAGDEKQFDVALRQLAGGLAAPFADVREELLLVLADVEAGLDFVEDDIEFIAQQDLLDRLLAAGGKLERIGGQLRSRSQGEKPIRVALVGQPNAGKSSLFNRLCGDRTAIVSGQAGTTRDYLIAKLSMGSIECEVVDTAGLNFSDEVCADELHGGLDQIGRTVSRIVMGETDLLLLCVDIAIGPTPGELQWMEQDRDRRLIVATKGDSFGDSVAALSAFPPATIITSATTGEGIDNLKTLLIEKTIDGKHNEVTAVPATILRCRESLRIAESELNRSVDSVRNRVGDEVTAFCIRIALDAIGEISGLVYTDDVLDRVFSRFCIGK